MSKEAEKLSSSDAYRKRYQQYQEIYCETCLAMTPPPPPEPEPGDPANPKAGVNKTVQKTALTRKVRYNDPKQRQSLKSNK